jgi:phage-related holin
MIMKVLPCYFASMFNCLLLAFEGKFSSLSEKRAFAGWAAAIVVLVVIGAALAVFYIIVTTPSATTTTSVYP